MHSVGMMMVVVVVMMPVAMIVRVRRTGATKDMIVMVTLSAVLKDKYSYYIH